MKILITGGSGFLGRNLALELSKNLSNQIYIFDKKKFHIKKKNIFFYKCDLNKYKSIANIYNFDYIYHMAAELGVKNVINNPTVSLNTNYQTTLNIIRFANKNKNLKRLFFFSTSEVYSNLNKFGKMSELDELQLPDIKHPRTSYWLGKVIGEFLVIHSKLNYTIFRIFNAYGPYTKTTHVIPSVFEKLKKNKYSTFENPNHFRAFIYIKDIIEIFLLSMKKNFNNQIINIGNSEETINIKSLVKKISLILNKNNKYKFQNVKNQSIKKRVPDNKKLKKLIGKKFIFTKLEDGLNLIYEKNKHKK